MHAARACHYSVIQKGAFAKECVDIFRLPQRLRFEKNEHLLGRLDYQKKGLACVRNSKKSSSDKNKTTFGVLYAIRS
jgi:hypothetical protein